MKQHIARCHARSGGVARLAAAGGRRFRQQNATDRDLTPPIRRGGKLADPERKARADRISQARLDGLFGQRWKCETVRSVIERLSGDVIRSRSWRLQRRKPMLKALVCNLHRQVRFYLCN